jgi:hypothetical protein
VSGKGKAWGISLRLAPDYNLFLYQYVCCWSQKPKEMRKKYLEFWIRGVRSLAAAERVALKKHCILRMRQRRITVDELKEALVCSEIVEYYEDDYPLPSALILGYTISGKPLHAVVAWDQESNIIWIITLYEPTSERWDEQFRIRRL